MPGFDDRLRQHLGRAAPPADPSGAFDRILERKIKRRLMRRFQAAGLAFVVVAATIGGTFALVRAFDSRDEEDRLGDISPTPGPVSNGLIAYASLDGGDYDIWTANPDGSGAVNLTQDSIANETTPAWSPDGMSITFASDRGGNWDVYVMDSTGADQARLTQSPGRDQDPAWSPDGSMIAYVADDDISIMNSDGSDPTRLTTGPDTDRHPTWASDGSRIAFARSGDQPVFYGPGTPPNLNGGIFVVNLDGRQISELTPEPDATVDEESPDWSPDGSKLVFSRAGNIVVMNNDGSGMTRIIDSEEFNSPSFEPAWSPDGRMIVLSRRPAGESSGQIHTANADGSNLSALGLNGVEDVAPDWQPIPGTAPTSSPTAEPTPTTSPLPAECDATQVTGNFDGDGQADTATVARTQCLVNPDELGNRATEFALRVQWPPSEGIAPLPDCRNVCRAVAATDLNGDGVDEFILQIDEGTTNVFLFYELPASEAFGRPSDIEPPGTEGFPAGKPARFLWGGSVEHFVALGCDFAKRQVIVQVAEPNQARNRYNVHEILLRFDTLESPPFGRFTVVSERDFTEPLGYKEGIGPGDQFEPGEPCWLPF